MADYWMTFRLARNETYQARYKAMLDAMVRLRGNHASWGEPTSFWAFGSDVTDLDRVARVLSAKLDRRVDLLVVGLRGRVNATYFGVLEHPEIFRQVFPFSKKLP